LSWRSRSFQCTSRPFMNSRIIAQARRDAGQITAAAQAEAAVIAAYAGRQAAAAREEAAKQVMASVREEAAGTVLGAREHAARTRELARERMPVLVGRTGAAVIHALACLPWVVFLVGVGLRSRKCSCAPVLRNA
jgi:hypothetical protein